MGYKNKPGLQTFKRLPSQVMTHRMFEIVDINKSWYEGNAESRV